MSAMDLKGIRDAVRAAYSKAACEPEGSHPFPVGRRFASSVGYPSALLKTIPKLSITSFSGVSNVSIFSEIGEGMTVLDLGCGAGLDAICASRRVGPQGRVVGVDFSLDMVSKARRAIVEADAENLDVVLAGGEGLPLETGSVDAALVNGIFNLNPYRERMFRELARVVRKGGTVWSAEIILKGPLPDAHKRSEAAWFAWIGGAKEGGAFLEEFLTAGFSKAEILRTMRNARTQHQAVVAAEVVVTK